MPRSRQDFHGCGNAREATLCDQRLLLVTVCPVPASPRGSLVSPVVTMIELG